MRGIEGMPITLIAVALLLVIIAYVGFVQMQAFLKFNDKRIFKEQAASLVQEMKLLKATGNVGSFTTKPIRIPSGYTLLLDLDNDILAGDLVDEVYNITLSPLAINLTAFKRGDIIKNRSVSLGGSTYTIVLHYGSLPDTQLRDFTLTFE